MRPLNRHDAQSDRCQRARKALVYGDCGGKGHAMAQDDGGDTIGTIGLLQMTPLSACKPLYSANERPLTNSRNLP